MTSPRPETLEREKDKLYLSDAELIRWLGVKDDGSMGAMDGYTDDTIMCAAISLYLIPNALKATRESLTKKDLGLR